MVVVVVVVVIVGRGGRYRYIVIARHASHLSYFTSL